MNHIELEQIINEKLAVQDFQDYAPNGLQVEGREQVQRVVTGVTA
ncbi:Nif3-like dinuclear metal center protein, partial [Morganella morganii]